ncbi:MAG: hypothetical protein Q7S05_02290 [bacterium]|nr:hypothetical protein [bacterium]
MTDAEIEKEIGDFHDNLLRRADEIASYSPLQQILARPEYRAELEMMLRERIGGMKSCIVRHATVNHSRSPEEALEALEAVGFLVFPGKNCEDVVKNMPRGDCNELDVYLFRPNCDVDDDDLERELGKLVLRRANPFALIDVNERDPGFVRKYPNGTHWKDESGKWCYIAFRCSPLTGKRVYIGRRTKDWKDRWWHAGEPK